MKSIEPIIRKITEKAIPELHPEQTSKLLPYFKRASKLGFKTKTGGNGINRTDDEMFIKSSKGELIPVIIEYKGIEGYTIDCSSHKLIFTKNNGAYILGENSAINKCAVNGACYYSSVLLRSTKEYDHVLAIGINGWYNPNKTLHYEFIPYALSRNSSTKVTPLNDEHKTLYGVTPLKKLLTINSTDTADNVIIPIQKRSKQKHYNARKSSKQLYKKLTSLNQKLHDMYENHVIRNQITPSKRISLILCCLLASMDRTGSNNLYHLSNKKKKETYKFFHSNLRDSIETVMDSKFPVIKEIKQYNKTIKIRSDQDTRKYNALESFLNQIMNNNLYFRKINNRNTSVTEMVYDDVYKNIFPLYENNAINGETYFANVLYNVMTSWLDTEQLASENKDDVVLTPSYVADLMAHIAQVKEDSHVWDWALGSGGLLISAMNIMIKEASNKYQGDRDKRDREINKIRSNRLLGVEKLEDIYVLALVNMILAQDGESDIIKGSSIGSFNKTTLADKFNADRLLLNPPYDQAHTGHGMSFAEEAMSHMHKGKAGYASIIIMQSAGNGKATNENRNILNNNNSLIASIKMPINLFSGAQTEIYLFKIGTNQCPVQQRNVLFVDFTNDGYIRNHRKGAINIRSAICKDGKTIADHRYHDLEDLINKFLDYGCHDPAKSISKGYFQNQKHYIIKPINTNPNNYKCGNDWNFDDHAQNHLKVTDKDLTKSLKQYLSYKLKSWL